MFKNKTKTCNVLAIYLRSTPSLIDYHFSNMSDESNSSFSIIRRRTANSKNVLHLGFRYSKDRKPRKDGSQSWRCVKTNPVRGDSGPRE